MKYKIIKADPHENLEQKVNDAIKDGWEPIGGITIFWIDETALINTTRNIYAMQAMIKNN